MKNILLSLFLTAGLLSCAGKSVAPHRGIASSPNIKKGGFFLPPDSASKTLGLILYPRKRLSPSQKKKLIRLNKRLNFKVSGKGKSFPYYVLSHKSKKELSKKDVSLFCMSYTDQKFITSCHPDKTRSTGTETEVTQPQAGELADDSVGPPGNSDSCNPFADTDDIDYEGIPDFWAREAVGADFVDEEKKKIKDRLSKIETIVCDIPLYTSRDGRRTVKNHDVEVKDIVDGESGFNESKNNNCTTNSDILNLIHDLHRDDKGKIRLVNASIGPHVEDWDDQSFYPDKEKFKNIIWVNAAGNQWEEVQGLPEEFKQHHDDYFLIVGSVSPSGLPSAFSSEGEKVFISAPSDYFNTSCPPTLKKCSAFSGTSGATPLVTHGIKSVMEAHPIFSRSQLRRLFQKTATKMPFSFEKPRKNGAGMLNSYRAFKVAEKIAKFCKRTPPSARTRCIDKKLADKKSYKFKPPMNQAEIEEEFPLCSGKDKDLGGNRPWVFDDQDVTILGQGSESMEKMSSHETEHKTVHEEDEDFEKNYCPNRTKAINKLRKTALLDPDNKYLWQVLACINYDEGQYNLKDFYLNIGRDFKKKPLHPTNMGIVYATPESLRASRYFKNPAGFVRRAPLHPDKNFQKATVKAAVGLGAGGLPILKKGLRSQFESTQLAAIQTAGKMGKDGLPFLNAAMESKSMAKQVAAVEAAGYMGKPAIPILEKVMKINDPKYIALKYDVLHQATKHGDAATPVLLRAFENKGKKFEGIRLEALHVAYNLRKNLPKIVDLALRDESLRIRSRAIVEASFLPFKQALSLIKKGTRDPDKSIREKAKRYLEGVVYQEEERKKFEAKKKKK